MMINSLAKEFSTNNSTAISIVMIRCCDVALSRINMYKRLCVCRCVAIAICFSLTLWVHGKGVADADLRWAILPSESSLITRNAQLLAVPCAAYANVIGYRTEYVRGMTQEEFSRLLGVNAEQLKAMNLERYIGDDDGVERFIRDIVVTTVTPAGTVRMARTPTIKPLVGPLRTVVEIWETESMAQASEPEGGKGWRLSYPLLSFAEHTDLLARSREPQSRIRADLDHTVLVRYVLELLEQAPDLVVTADPTPRASSIQARANIEWSRDTGEATRVELRDSGDLTIVLETLERAESRMFPARPATLLLETSFTVDGVEDYRTHRRLRSVVADTKITEESIQFQPETQVPLLTPEQYKARMGWGRNTTPVADAVQMQRRPSSTIQTWSLWGAGACALGIVIVIFVKRRTAMRGL